MRSSWCKGQRPRVSNMGWSRPNRPLTFLGGKDGETPAERMRDEPKNQSRTRAALIRQRPI
eukprot:7351182-Pyramimonas_sp.AAC.1